MARVSDEVLADMIAERRGIPSNTILLRLLRELQRMRRAQQPKRKVK